MNCHWSCSWPATDGGNEAGPEEGRSATIPSSCQSKYAGGSSVFGVLSRLIHPFRNARTSLTILQSNRIGSGGAGCISKPKWDCLTAAGRCKLAAVQRAFAIVIGIVKLGLGCKGVGPGRSRVWPCCLESLNTNMNQAAAARPLS